MTTTAAGPDAERLFEAGRYDEALVAWQAIADRNPDSARAQARIGACLLALGRHADAAAVLERLAAAMPDQPMLLYRLAVARAARGRRRQPRRTRRSGRCGPPSRVRARCRARLRPARARARYVAIRARVEHNDAPTADDPRFRTFDFWVGTWEARTEDGVLQGVNRIERVLGGAAIVERWTGATGYRGTSLNRYDRRTDTWRQTWIDDQGDIVEFENGTARDGQVAFTAAMPTGAGAA